MNLALYGNRVAGQSYIYLQTIVDKLNLIHASIWIYEPFYVNIKDQIRFLHKPETFSSTDGIQGKVDLVISFGGDGTILEAATIVAGSGIPIVGINIGHLGFLASIAKEEVEFAFDEIISKRYHLDERTLLKLESVPQIFPGFRYAMNDLTVQKSNAQNMLTIRTYINNEFLNSYWADGLIVATPTGSTAYSLSCNGPILTPDSSNFVITPIASHNLTVRPIVVRDDSSIRIVVDGADNEFYVSLDSRIVTVTNSCELKVSRADFTIRLLRMSNRNFFQTLREKLKWGLDIRN